MTVVQLYPATAVGRWSSIQERDRSWPHCRYCARRQSYDCAPVACLACGSAQCGSETRPSGRCRVCLYGRLSDWPWSDDGCGVGACRRPVVASAPGFRQLCGAHMGRTLVSVGQRPMPLDLYIASRIKLRDTGGFWRWVA